MEYQDVEALVTDLYVPFANESRAITWPTDFERLENDAEHSFSLSLIAGMVASRIGLNPERAAVLGAVHDLVEIHAGDTSVWDDDGLVTKDERESRAFAVLETEYANFPWLLEAITEYESRSSEEARLVYALDKLLAVIMLKAGGGEFWKRNGITFEQHFDKYLAKREQVAAHPLVLYWYDNLHIDLEEVQENYFA